MASYYRPRIVKGTLFVLFGWRWESSCTALERFCIERININLIFTTNESFYISLHMLLPALGQSDLHDGLYIQ